MQTLLTSLFVIKIPSDLSFNKRSVFSKVVNQECGLDFELSVGSGIDITLFDILKFERRDKVNNREVHIDSIYRSIVTCDQCNNGTKVYAETGNNRKYNDDK